MPTWLSWVVAVPLTALGLLMAWASTAFGRDGMIALMLKSYRREGMAAMRANGLSLMSPARRGRHWFNVSLALEREGDDEGAEAVCRYAAECGFPPAMAKHGYHLHRRGDEAEAQALYLRAIEAGYEPPPPSRSLSRVGRSTYFMLFGDFFQWRPWFDISKDDRPVRSSVLLRMVFSDLVQLRFGASKDVEQVRAFLAAPHELPDIENYSHADLEAVVRSELGEPELIADLGLRAVKMRVRLAVWLREDLDLSDEAVVEMISRHERSILNSSN